MSKKKAHCVTPPNEAQIDSLAHKVVEKAKRDHFADALDQDEIYESALYGIARGLNSFNPFCKTDIALWLYMQAVYQVKDDNRKRLLINQREKTNLGISAKIGPTGAGAVEQEELEMTLVFMLPNERHRRIFCDIAVLGKKQAECAREIGVTRQRINFIYKKCQQRINAYMEGE